VPVAGLDEVGRGALAGPLVAAAVVLPLERRQLKRALAGVRDSKQMTEAQRRRWAERVRKVATAAALGVASAAEVDAIGPLAATRLAMERALADLPLAPRHLLLDHIALPGVLVPQTSITHGDALILSIAAASIIAKVWRDEVMCAYAEDFPAYGFEHHKGYGTPEHLAALDQHGPSPIHRRTFHPMGEEVLTQLTLDETSPVGGASPIT
jgi:ribonuclease HII